MRPEMAAPMSTTACPTKASSFASSIVAISVVVVVVVMCVLRSSGRSALARLCPCHGEHAADPAPATSGGAVPVDLAPRATQRGSVGPGAAVGEARPGGSWSTGFVLPGWAAEEDPGWMRSSREYCPIAAGVDILGDRWTPLVIRELMVGAGG